MTKSYKLRNSFSINGFIEYSNLNKTIPRDLISSRVLQRETKSILQGLKGDHINNSTGYKARVTSETIGKILRPAPKIKETKENYCLNLIADQHLDSIFNKAIYIDTLLPMKSKEKNKNEIGYHHFVAPLAVNNKLYRVIVTAREKACSNILYVIRVDVSILKYLTANDTKHCTISSKELMDSVCLWNYNLNSFVKYDFNDYICESSCIYFCKKRDFIIGK